jgi:hypothetical protein
MNSTPATTNTTTEPVASAVAPTAAVKTVATTKKVAPAKPAAKSAAKPVAKVAVKPVAKPPAKAEAKAAAKPSRKVGAKQKTTVDAAAKPTPKAAAKPAKPAKVKKPKMVRDSFTMPKAEFVVIESLKVRAAALKVPTKKTELIRAGIKALAAMSDTAFLSAVRAVPNLKTGRPAKGE